MVQMYERCGRDSICYCYLSSKDTLLKHSYFICWQSNSGTRNRITYANSVIDHWWIKIQLVHSKEGTSNWVVNCIEQGLGLELSTAATILQRVSLLEHVGHLVGSEGSAAELIKFLHRLVALVFSLMRPCTLHRPQSWWSLLASSETFHKLALICGSPVSDWQCGGVPASRVMV